MTCILLPAAFPRVSFLRLTNLELQLPGNGTDRGKLTFTELHGKYALTRDDGMQTIREQGTKKPTSNPDIFGVSKKIRKIHEI